MLKVVGPGHQRSEPRRKGALEPQALANAYPIGNLGKELEQARAFLRFLRRRKLFLIRPADAPIPVDASLLERYSRARSSGLHFVYFSDPRFVLDAQTVLNLADAAKLLQQHYSGLELPNPARAQLAERAERGSAAASLLPYQGSSLAIARKEEPALHDIARAYGCSTLDFAVPANRRRGRPTLQARAAAAYREMFPNGHGHLGWKEVARQLKRGKGIDTSVDTLKRALGHTQNPQNSAAKI